MLAHLQSFFDLIAQGKVHIYNEFSLQHELGCYLRSALVGDRNVQFERPAEFFGIPIRLLKKEIDIALFSDSQAEKIAIELKYPKNGQYPEQMYKACQDIRFLEQLCEHGFSRGYFVMVADDPGFYSGKTERIYRYFRGAVSLTGTIQKPTGLRDTDVTLYGEYSVVWHHIEGKCKYAVVEIIGR